MGHVLQANTVLLAQLFLSVAQSIRTKLVGVGAIFHLVCHAPLEKSALQVTRSFIAAHLENIVQKVQTLLTVHASPIAINTKENQVLIALFALLVIGVATKAWLPIMQVPAPLVSTVLLGMIQFGAQLVVFVHCREQVTGLNAVNAQVVFTVHI